MHQMAARRLAHVLLTLLISALLLHGGLCAGFRGVARGAQSSYAQGVLCLPRDSIASDVAPVRVPASRINDNYCDCRGGEDEPGTAACSHGHFWCENAGFRGAKIPRAWVDDGHCDCCDGSDEAPGICSDRCGNEKELYERKTRAAADSILKGVGIRETLVASARRAKRKDEKLLVDAKRELKRLAPQLANNEKIVESLRKLRLPADAADTSPSPIPVGLQEDARSHSEGDTGTGAAHAGMTSSAEDDIQDRSEDYEPEARIQKSETNDPDINEEVMPDNAVNNLEEVSGVVEDPTRGHFSTETPAASTEHRDAGLLGDPTAASNDGTPTDSVATQDQLYVGSNDTNDVDVAAICPSLTSKNRYSIILQNYLVTKGHRWFPSVMRILRFDPSTIGGTGGQENSCLERAEAAQRDLNSKKTELESKIQALEARIGRDYGDMDDVLRTLEGKCIKRSFAQYEYELCHFDKVQQYEHGNVIAKLGQWGQWEGNGNDRVMSFQDGDQCWNGPRRSIKVTIECGEEDDLISVDEPNRCSYEMKMKSPAACRREAADAILAGIASNGHDEL
jgi:protein kinase C substrate 80K-H